MKAYIIVATAVGLLANQLSAATVMSGPFILVPDYFNGLESIGADYYLGGPSYSEGGITISYLGTITPQARGAGPQSNGVWTTWTTQIGGEGSYGWYGPGMGYTSITLTNGNDINQIQFLAGSGWGLQTSFMQFQLLNDGGVVLSGVVPISSGNCSTGFWQSGGTCNGGAMSYFGFSGGGFDEVRLQNQGAPAGSFNSGAFEAGGYDSIAVIQAAPSSGVPEPSSLPLVTLAISIVTALRLKRGLK